MTSNLNAKLRKTKGLLQEIYKFSDLIVTLEVPHETGPHLLD